MLPVPTLRTPWFLHYSTRLLLFYIQNATPSYAGWPSWLSSRRLSSPNAARVSLGVLLAPRVEYLDPPPPQSSDPHLRACCPIPRRSAVKQKSLAIVFATLFGIVPKARPTLTFSIWSERSTIRSCGRDWRCKRDQATPENQKKLRLFITNSYYPANPQQANSGSGNSGQGGCSNKKPWIGILVCLSDSVTPFFSKNNPEATSARQSESFRLSSNLVIELDKVLEKFVSFFQMRLGVVRAW